MSDIEIRLKELQNQIDSLNKQLNEAQNQKITAEVHLQNEQQEYENIMKELCDITGLNNVSEVESYITEKETEINNIIQDLQRVSSCVHDQYTFSEGDVQLLRDVVNKYNIPIVTGE